MLPTQHQRTNRSSGEIQVRSLDVRRRASAADLRRGGHDDHVERIRVADDGRERIAPPEVNRGKTQIPARHRILRNRFEEMFSEGLEKVERRFGTIEGGYRALRASADGWRWNPERVVVVCSSRNRSRRTVDQTVNVALRRRRVDGAKLRHPALASTAHAGVLSPSRQVDSLPGQ